MLHEAYLQHLQSYFLSSCEIVNSGKPCKLGPPSS